VANKLIAAVKSNLIFYGITGAILIIIVIYLFASGELKG
jgi:hypothetical protein